MSGKHFFTLEFIPGTSPTPPDTPVHVEPEAPLPEPLEDQMRQYRARIQDAGGQDKESLE